jgi:non-heme chloroperoxidase
MSLSRKPVMASISERENREIKAANPGRGPLLIIDGAKDHTVPWAIANAA